MIGPYAYRPKTRSLWYISKAFDVVSHDKLFARLHSYGIRDALLVWLQNFFSYRTHQSKVNLSLSDVAVWFQA